MHPATIGPFKIERELGRGGMGVVYLATDTRLDRQVAIKALPADLAADPDRLARFQREAKVLALLNHPHVGGIHGLEQSGGQQFLVLEYIEGETLANRLGSGPISVADSLALAKQIAEALEAAHDKGIIHRDLKPGNIMVTPEGAVKVLDFGLARTAEGSPSSTNAFARADSPTLTSPARFANSPTIQGVIMGTAGYMSPEQARGKPVDKRSDIFSFGCVVYEMLTGTMPFRGETVADAIGATLHKESDLNLLPSNTPGIVRLLLTQCLAKDRGNRLRDIGDARLMLAQAISDPRGAAFGLGSDGANPQQRGRNPALIAALVGVAVIGGTFPLWSGRIGLGGKTAPAPAPVVRFTITPPTGYTLPNFTGLGSNIAISPSGDRIVFVAQAQNKTYLCIRDVAEGQSRVLANSEDCSNPFFSPDGKWVGFVSNGRLLKMPADGGPALAICDVSNFSSFAWLDDGTIVWGASYSGIWRVNSQGGSPTQVAKAGPETTAPQGGKPVLGFDVPVSVPGADYILCNSWDGPTTENFNLLAVSLKDGAVRTVIRTVTEPRLIARDRLVFVRGTTAMTVGFDPFRGEIVGEPTVALEGIRTDQWQDSAYIGASSSGTFAYVPGGRFGAGKRIVRVDETGKVTPVLETTDSYAAAPIISPDGRKAVLTTLRSKIEMWVLDLERGSMSLVSSDGEHYAPVWSIDGSSILAQYFALDGKSSLARWPVGGGAPTLLPGTTGSDTFVTPSQELPDGLGLVVQTVGTDITAKSDIAVYSYKTATFTPVRNRPSNEGEASVSSDGKWIAYSSDESGRYEVYLGPFSSNGPNVQVSNQGGFIPRFSRDGKHVYFADLKGMIYAAKIEMGGAAPVVSTPVKVLDYKSLNLQASSRGGFDVLPEGGFLMIEQATWEKEPPVIHVILNWAEELRRKGTK